MPNVVGLAEPAATSLLTAADFHVTVEVRACNSAALPAGTVCQTEPMAGQQVPAGETVVIDVAPQRRPTP